MNPQDAQRCRVLEAIDREAPQLWELACWMGGHPELSLEEHATSQRYRDFLEQRGFQVEAGVADMPTAFLAERGVRGATLAVALLAEMDALPEIGHACGHNLSGPASLLAASALSAVVPEERLRVVVVGSPAEETGVGKRRLVEAGAFDGMSAVLMAHASDMRRAHRLFLGNRKFEFVFRGRASHAAAYPERGRNALDGVIGLFVSMGLLRQQIPRAARIHGIVSDGGQAPNIIPERAAARVWVRALEDEMIEDVAGRVCACARAAAQASGTEVEIREQENSSPPMRPNLPLADLYRRQLDRLGLAETPHPPDACIGSSDITHVSRVVPTIHPNFPIGEALQLHTRAFSEATLSPLGRAGLLEGARALALTALELAYDPDVREQVAEAEAR